jgi:UDP-3-O-acyl-N-acetylglucosamine deacetylase
VVGHLVAHRAGHALHAAFVARIIEETGAWQLVDEPAGEPAAIHAPAVAENPAHLSS